LREGGREGWWWLVAPATSRRLKSKGRKEGREARKEIWREGWQEW
jgi:hypothetical protein